MTEPERRRGLERILDSLADQLDVAPAKYADAKKRYDAVGSWLGADDSELAPYHPDVYPQGSFALGTAVQPLGDDDYDVDAVCLLDLSADMVTQEQLKEMVGKRLRAHRTYMRMLDPPDGGRRCWKLRYADESRFHLDVLPAIPDEYGWLLSMGIPREHARHAICITDMSTWGTDRRWPKSNPRGFAQWFRARMLVALEQRRRAVAMEKRAEVTQIPDYEVRTPLQRVIQLLKRHRDVRYRGDEDRPISIIITTLAARAYDNEDSLVEALLNVVPGMRAAIETRNGVHWVENPVNLRENFADRWVDEPRKAQLFLDWLTAVEREHAELLTGRGFAQVGDYLVKSYGQRDASAVMEKYASRTSRVMSATAAGLGERTTARSMAPSRFDVPHRERPDWPMGLAYRVSISARASRDGFRPIDFHSDPQPLRKHFSLRFVASTDTPQPFDVYWQVVNTGEEATRANGLRGSIFPGSSIQGESTLYQGMHWIECFIVKGGRCVARSGEFVVNIA